MAQVVWCFIWKRKLIDELPPFLGGGGMINEVSLDGATYAGSASKV